VASLDCLLGAIRGAVVYHDDSVTLVETAQMVERGEQRVTAVARDDDDRYLASSGLAHVCSAYQQPPAQPQNLRCGKPEGQSAAVGAPLTGCSIVMAQSICILPGGA
jgi:hypothetical protein